MRDSAHLYLQVLGLEVSLETDARLVFAAVVPPQSFPEPLHLIQHILQQQGAHSSYMTLIGVHELHGRMHPN